MIIIGTNNIAAAYVGATAVEKAYVGNNQIYPNTSLTLSASELSFAAAGQSLTLDIVVDENKPWTITAPNDWQVSPLSGTGPASITVTAANNTSANRRSGTLMVSSEQDAASCTLTQEAGVKFFSEVTISAFSYPDISAKGGSVAPKLNYTQTWTWNEVAGSGGNITTGATVVYTGDNVDTEGNVTAPSKGTTISNRTKITSTSVTVTLNGKSAAAQADVYQSGNYVTKLTILDGSMSYPSISAGATSAAPSIVAPYVKFTFSSGSVTSNKPDATYGSYNSTVKFTLGSVQNGFTSVNQNSGILTATNRGTVIGAARSSGVITRKTVGTWSPTSSYDSSGTVTTEYSLTATCTQEGNYIESLKIGGNNLSSYTAASGSFNAGENSHFYTGWAILSSGADLPITTWVPGDWIVSQNYFSKSSSEAGVLKITAVSRGTTAGAARTATLTYSLTSPSTNNQTLSATINLTQAANGVMSYGIPTGRTLSVSDIPASGGTISSGTLGGTITQTRTFSSGSSDTITNPTVTSSSYSAGVYNGSLGNTVVPRTKKGTLTYSYVCNGKTGSVSADVYQQANNETSITYGTPVVALSVSDIPASGGTVSSGTVTYTQTRVQNYTSGGTRGLSNVTSGGSISYSTAISANSKGTTVSSRTKIGTLTATVVLNDKKGSGVADVYQQANSATYGAVSISGGSVPVIPASGGSVASMSGISASQTVSFTSGSSRAGSAKITYSNTVTASSKGISISNQTTAGTLTATATGEGSKTATKSLTVYQAGNYVTTIKGSVGTFSYPTIGAGATSATPNLSAGFGVLFTFSSGSTSSSTPAATYGSLSVPSSFKLSTAQNGFTAVNSSTGVLTATNRGSTIGNARTSGTVTRTLTATWTPTNSYNTAGTKTSTWNTTATCTQAANQVESIKIGGNSGNSNIWGEPKIDVACTANEWWSYSCWATYSSNATKSILASDFTLTSNQSWATVSAGNQDWLKRIDFASRETTVGAERTVMLSATYSGKSASLTITQAANTLTWNMPNISRTTPVTIAAAGGTNNVATGLTYSQTGQYSSGSPASATSGGKLSYSVVTAKTGFSLSGSTVTATNNTSTSARNGFVVRISLTLNGKTTTKDITYNQAAGSKVYGAPSVSLSYPTVAYNVTYADPKISYSQVWTWNGVSGSGGTINSGGSVSYTGSGGTAYPTNGVSGRITWGTNSSTSVRSITVTATVTLNGVKGTGSTTAKQSGYTGPVDIYITTSFNYATSQIQINFSAAPKDTFFIKFMGYDNFGSIWEYTTGIVPNSSTSVLFSPPGYSISNQFSIESVGATEYTLSSTSPYETSNARYYWQVS